MPARLGGWRDVQAQERGLEQESGVEEGCRVRGSFPWRASCGPLCSSFHVHCTHCHTHEYMSLLLHNSGSACVHVHGSPKTATYVQSARTDNASRAAPSEIDIPQHSSGPTYDAAYLSQLKASTPSARPSLPTDAYDADVSMDVDSPASLSVLSAIPDDQTEAAIPSASSILAAKQKRERLRTNKGGDDYISLSVSKRDDFSQGPHPESRLVREEDELGDADDGM